MQLGQNKIVTSAKNQFWRKDYFDDNEYFLIFKIDLHQLNENGNAINKTPLSYTVIRVQEYNE